MQNKLIGYFSKITTLSKEELKALEEGMVITDFKKDTFTITIKCNILESNIDKIKVCPADYAQIN